MGRPRKAPRRITTFNLPLPLAEQIDGLNLTNRSEWMAGVLKDYFQRRAEDADTAQQRARLNADPAVFIARIPDRTLLAAALARVPFDKVRLRQDLSKAITNAAPTTANFAGTAEAVELMQERDANLRDQDDELRLARLARLFEEVDP